MEKCVVKDGIIKAREVCGLGVNMLSISSNEDLKIGRSIDEFEISKEDINKEFLKISIIDAINNKGERFYEKLNKISDFIEMLEEYIIDLKERNRIFKGRILIEQKIMLRTCSHEYSKNKILWWNGNIDKCNDLISMINGLLIAAKMDYNELCIIEKFIKEFNLKNKFQIFDNEIIDEEFK